MADAGADDDADEDKDERIRWYENQDCNEIGEEAEEDDNDGEDDGISSDDDSGGNGSVITDHGISTDATVALYAIMICYSL